MYEQEGGKLILEFQNTLFLIYIEFENDLQIQKSHREIARKLSKDLKQVNAVAKFAHQCFLLHHPQFQCLDSLYQNGELLMSVVRLDYTLYQIEPEYECIGDMNCTYLSEHDNIHTGNALFYRDLEKCLDDEFIFIVRSGDNWVEV